MRFLSHHDALRAIQRTVRRADLPVRYSQGFNPHPAISLPCPRPVGIASQDDMLVLELQDAGDNDGGDLADRLNRHAPLGMRFSRAEPLAGGRPPHPVRVEYELPLEMERSAATAERLNSLAGEASWPTERRSGDESRSAAPRTIDLRPLIVEARLDPGAPPSLRWAHVPQGDLWARPGEFLRLLGLDERADLAGVVRRRVEYA